MYFHAKEAIVKKHPEFLFRHGLKLGSIETIWRLGALGMSQMNLFSSNNLTFALEECMINSVGLLELANVENGHSHYHLSSEEKENLGLYGLFMAWETAKFNGIPKLSRENILWD